MQKHWRKGLVLVAAVSPAIAWVGCSGDDTFVQPGSQDSGITSSDGSTPSDSSTTHAGDAGSDTGTTPVSDAATDGGDGGDAGAPAIQIPGQAPYDQWTWIPVAGAVCADGSPTGIAVSPHASSSHLTIYFEGGGACWTDATCQGQTTLASYLSGYSTPEFNAEFGDGGTVAGNGILDRSSANPLQEENFIYVPYCTGDIHAGNNVATYTNSDGGTFNVHHVGYNNAALDLAVVKATFPTVSRLIVTGSSAGGYGALFNYEQIHQAYPGVQSFLIDDSGPPLAAGDEYAAQNAQWHSWQNVAPDCPACTPADGGAFVNIFPYLTKQDPTFRGSLLETDHDMTISAFFSAPGEGAYGALVNGNENNAGCVLADGGVGPGPCDFTQFLDDVYTGGVVPANQPDGGQMRAFVENAAFHTYLLTPAHYAQVLPFLESQLELDGGLDGGWTDQVPTPF